MDTLAYDVVCQDLQIDPANPELLKSKIFENDSTVEDRHPKSYQITEISFLVNLSNSDIKSVLLADDCELGKTITTLYSLWVSGNRAMKGEPPWRPVLVVVPPGLLDVWIEEYMRIDE